MKTFFIISVLAGFLNMCIAIYSRDISEALGWFAATMGLLGFLIRIYQDEVYEDKD